MSLLKKYVSVERWQSICLMSLWLMCMQEGSTEDQRASRMLLVFHCWPQRFAKFKFCMCFVYRCLCYCMLCLLSEMEHRVWADFWALKRHVPLKEICCSRAVANMFLMSHVVDVYARGRHRRSSKPRHPERVPQVEENCHGELRTVPQSLRVKVLRYRRTGTQFGLNLM